MKVQRYIGFSPQTSFARWGLLAIGLGIVLGATLPTAIGGLAETFVSHPDMFPWYVTRIMAFIAYLAIAGSVIYGLLLSTKILDVLLHRPVTYALHQDLASVGILFAVLHIGALLFDHFVPFTLIDVIVPFIGPYRPLAIAAGQLAIITVVVVTGSFYVRRRIGQKRWRSIHVLAFIAFIAVTAHGIAAGTDTSMPWAFAIYVGAAATVAFLLGVRLTLLVAKRSAEGAVAGLPVS